MARKITDIYTEYKIMPNLQAHMFRVAAVASLICDNFDQPLPKEEIVTACLLHDMGNIIKSKFEIMPEFLEPQGLKYWQNVKDEYIKKYGTDEDKAHIQIMKELKVSAGIISLVEKLGFRNACEYSKVEDFTTKIVNYADWRVDPYGVVSLEGRMSEAKKRYMPKTKAEDEVREALIDCCKEIEKQIFKKCSVKPEDINDATAAPIISKLRNFVIK